MVSSRGAQREEFRPLRRQVLEQLGQRLPDTAEPLALAERMLNDQCLMEREGDLVDFPHTLDQLEPRLGPGQAAHHLDTVESYLAFSGLADLPQEGRVALALASADPSLQARLEAHCRPSRLEGLTAVAVERVRRRAAETRLQALADRPHGSSAELVQQAASWGADPVQLATHWLLGVPRGQGLAELATVLEPGQSDAWWQGLQQGAAQRPDLTGPWNRLAGLVPRLGLADAAAAEAYVEGRVAAGEAAEVALGRFLQARLLGTEVQNLETGPAHGLAILAEAVDISGISLPIEN